MLQFVYLDFLFLENLNVRDTLYHTQIILKSLLTKR